MGKIPPPPPPVPAANPPAGSQERPKPRANANLMLMYPPPSPQESSFFIHGSSLSKRRVPETRPEPFEPERMRSGKIPVVLVGHFAVVAVVVFLLYYSLSPLGGFIFGAAYATGAAFYLRSKHEAQDEQ